MTTPGAARTHFAETHLAGVIFTRAAPSRKQATVTIIPGRIQPIVNPSRLHRNPETNLQIGEAGDKQHRFAAQPGWKRSPKPNAFYRPAA
ncbi:MAG TPA: hypothetical protein VG651_12680 [Stellaceae bacterium]|nr:hypothetical protein [Stellaceae bacterium]